MFILGGNPGIINCERYNFKRDTWEVVDVAGLELIGSWKSFGYSSYSVKVAFEEDKEANLLPSLEKCRNTNYIFGTDDEPFLVEID